MPVSSAPNAHAAGALHAVLLAGGRSSRLHASAPVPVPDKPLLRSAAPGRRPTLLDAALGALASRGVAPERTAVVGPPDLPVPAGCLLTREDPPYAGPAEAVLAGLEALAPQAADDDPVLVLAADMPQSGPGLDALLAARSSGEGTTLVGVENGILQPMLCLLPQAAALAAFRERVAAPREPGRGISMRSCLRPLGPVEVPVPDGAATDVDTWADALALGWTEGDPAPAPRRPKRAGREDRP